jgi:hypothetical protein
MNKEKILEIFKNMSFVKITDDKEHLIYLEYFNKQIVFNFFTNRIHLIVDKSDSGKAKTLILKLN